MPYFCFIWTTEMAFTFNTIRFTVKDQILQTSILYPWQPIWLYQKDYCLISILHFLSNYKWNQKQNKAYVKFGNFVPHRNLGDQLFKSDTLEQPFRNVCVALLTQILTGVRFAV